MKNNMGNNGNNEIENYNITNKKIKNELEQKYGINFKVLKDYEKSGFLGKSN